jgi:hypothetical protein
MHSKALNLLPTSLMCYTICLGNPKEAHGQSVSTVGFGANEPGSSMALENNCNVCRQVQHCPSHYGNPIKEG